LVIFLTEYLEYARDGTSFETNNTWEYKPFTARDIPIDLRVSLLKDAPNPIGILSSKASGEPPLALSCSALFAVQNAVAEYRASVGLKNTNFSLTTNGPATVDVVRRATNLDTSISEFKISS